MTRSRAQVLTNQTLNKTEQVNEANDEQSIETKKTKKIKKSSKKESKENEDDQVVETRYEIREDGKKVKIKRVKKKVKKEAAVGDEKVEKKTKSKKIKKKLNKTNEDNKENLDKSIDHLKKNNLNDEKNDELNNFKLELNESEDDLNDNHSDDKKLSPVVVSTENELENLNKTEDKIDLAKDTDTNELINSSLITNDEEKVDNEHDLTKDITNTTFEKKEEFVPCTSFYSKKEEMLAVDTPKCVEETKSCHLETKSVENKQIETESKIEEEAKPRTGGARIVRPKQTVTVMQAIKTNKNETRVEEVKKIVEVGKIIVFIKFF